jgi:type II secretory pathway component PulF
MMMFMSQMTIMCQSGVDLAEALTNVTSQITKPKLRLTLEQVAEDVRNGISFSEAASKHPTVFNNSFIAGITAGEQSGEIEAVLERLTQLMRKDVKLKGTIRSMLMYPLVLCCITAMVFAALMFFVLPQFSGVFKDLDRPAPPLTAVLLGLGATLRSNIVTIFVVAGGLVCASLFLFRQPSFHLARDKFLLKFFLIKNTTSCLIAGRLLRLLGTLLSAGVPLVDCIRLCRRSTRNRPFQDLFEAVEDGVMHGEGLAKKMFESTFLPKGAAQMVKTAESSGRLGDILQTLGEYYEDEGERHLRDLVKIAEPAIIVGLGGVVAVIVLAVLIPLLDVTTAAA